MHFYRFVFFKFLVINSLEIKIFDDMEGILVYVIIGIIYFARFLLKKKNEEKQIPPGQPQPRQSKKTSPSGKQEPSPPEPVSLEDLIGEFFGEQKKSKAPEAKPIETVQPDPLVLQKQRRENEERKRREREKEERERRARIQIEEERRREKMMEELAKQAIQANSNKIKRVKPKKI